MEFDSRIVFLVLDFSKEYENKTKDIEDILVEEGDSFIIEVSHTNLKNFSSGIMLKQGFPTWRTRPPRGTRGAVIGDASFSSFSSHGEKQYVSRIAIL